MKKLKVFYMDKRLKDIYPHATRFQVFKYKLARFVRKVVICSFILGAIYGAFQVGRITTEPILVKAEDKSATLYAQKVDALKTKVVAEIQSCESAGHKEADGIIIFDTNNKASIGTMQFQVATVIHYYKALYNKVITPKEATLIALDNAQATALAKDIMFTTKNMAGKDWVNCTAKYDSDTKISIIKSLEQ